MTGALGLACIATSSRGLPLYPSTGERPDETKVAQLSGYVRFVDEQDVSSRAKLFELRPGCHVVGTPSKWIGSTLTGTGDVSATTGQVTFALPMRAGYQYSVEVLLPPMSGPTTLLQVKAFESDMRGTRTRIFERARSESDLEACRDEAGEELPAGDASGVPADTGGSADTGGPADTGGDGADAGRGP
jgi:hypothetical protein